MGWKIIVDYDAKNVEEEVGYVGRERNYEGGTSLVRVGDDDGNIYYLALCDGDEGMENFFDWSTCDSGASWSDYWCIKKNEWRGFIS
jgi:hypothetical protein